MKITSIFLFALSLSSAATTFAAVPGDSFIGKDDSGLEVNCLNLPGKTECRYQRGIRSFTGLNLFGGHVLNKCFVDDRGVPVSCEGRNYWKEVSVFLKTSAVGTGLAKCAFYLDGTERVFCDEFYNPDAGIWGNPWGRKSIVRCKDQLGRRVMFDQATENHFGRGDGLESRFTKNDLGLQITNFYQRNLLFDTPVYLERSGGVNGTINLIEHNYSGYHGEIVAVLPADLRMGEKVVGQITTYEAHGRDNRRNKSEMIPMECQVVNDLPAFESVYPRKWPQP